MSRWYFDKPGDVAKSVKLGVLLRRRREELEISQTKVAAFTGIDSTLLSRLENGQIQKPAFTDIEKLCNHYSYPLDQLIKDAGIRDYEESEIPDKNKIEYEKAKRILETIATEASEQEVMMLVCLLRAYGAVLGKYEVT